MSFIDEITDFMIMLDRIEYFLVNKDYLMSPPVKSEVLRQIRWMKKRLDELRRKYGFKGYW